LVYCFKKNLATLLLARAKKVAQKLLREFWNTKPFAKFICNKSFFSKLQKHQGDKIGQILDYWVIVYLLLAVS
jgi:hypothetical protein